MCVHRHLSSMVLDLARLRMLLPKGMLWLSWKEWPPEKPARTLDRAHQVDVQGTC